MGNNRLPGNKNIIKSNLKNSDRISVIYNNEAVEMSLTDFITFMSSSLSGDYLPLTGGTITGNLAVDGQAYSDSITPVEPTGTTQTLNWNNGNGQIIDLDSATGSVTLTLTNPNMGATYIIKVIQGDTTARDIVYPASVLFPGGTAPVITATLGAEDLIVLFYDGTNYLASFNQDFS